MNRDLNATDTGRIGVLDDVFRWVTYEEQSWGGTRLRLPPRRAHEVYDLDPFFGL
jgi:hypothetical protein